MSKESIIVVTTPTVPGCEIVKVLGAVHGLTVRIRGVGGKIMAGIEGIFGGEVSSYTSECEKARKESIDRLIENARRMGANAIVGQTLKQAIYCRAQQQPSPPTEQSHN